MVFLALPFHIVEHEIESIYHIKMVRILNEFSTKKYQYDLLKFEMTVCENFN